MDSLKLLKGMLISVNASGLLNQFLRENSLVFSLIENDRVALEWMLENIQLEKENWIDIVKARRKLVVDLKEIDFSYELNLLKSYLEKNINKDFLKEITSNPKAEMILNERDRKSFVDAYAMEYFFEKMQASPFLFEKLLNFNQHDIIDLSNKIDEKRSELFEKVKKESLSFSFPSNFHNRNLLQQSWYAENQFKKGQIDLAKNYFEPKKITDLDFLVESIKQDYKNYEYINENFKSEQRILDVLIEKLENSLNKLMSDQNDSDQLSPLAIVKVSKIIASSFDIYLEKSKRSFLDESLKARCIAIGVPINDKLLSDKEMLQIISVNYSVFEKFKENKANKNLMQSGIKLNDALFLDEKVFVGLPVFSKLCEILESTNFFTDLNSNQSVKENYVILNNLVNILKDELKKDLLLKDFVSNNQNFEWSKFAGVKLKDCKYGEFQNFLEHVLPEVEKRLMKKDIVNVENDKSVKKQSVLKF